MLTVCRQIVLHMSCSNSAAYLASCAGSTACSPGAASLPSDCVAHIMLEFCRLGTFGGALMVSGCVRAFLPGIIIIYIPNRDKDKYISLDLIINPIFGSSGGLTINFVLPCV